MNLLALIAAGALDAATIAQNSATLQALGPHPFGSPRNQAAAEFLAAKMKEAGLPQTAVDQFGTESILASNVIASIPGRSDRIVILATHHDTARDGSDLAARSRAMSLLAEIGKQASRLRPAKTWILASFDGGAAAGEGFTHYLETLGKNRALIDGLILIDAQAPTPTAAGLTLSAPSCAAAPASNRRGIASSSLVAASLARVPQELDVAFDDPGISLLTQPFIRAFRTRCDPTAARATEAGIGTLVAGDRSFSRRLLATPSAPGPSDPLLKDEGAARLAQLGFAALQGIDETPLPPRQSDSWLVLGREVFSGWLLFLAGCLSLAPGLLTLRGNSQILGLRAAYSLLFVAGLYFEPEVALFAGLLPNLIPTGFSRKALIPALGPLILLIAAGVLTFVRGQADGTWLSAWFWIGLVIAGGLLFATIGAGGRRPAAKSRKKK